ncbi:retrovirus-related pol polyprotein from transposon TNT 1-94 [Tanacetum coccineum]
MLIFSRAPLFLWAEAIATACYTQNCSIIHHRFDKTSYELINGIKPDISFLCVFGALCYPKNDREDIGTLGAKGDIGFFIGYFANSCAYRVYNRRTKKIMETMNVTFDELSTMAFEQRSSKLGLQSMTFRQISSGLDLTYALSTITTQKPTKRELDLLFEAMYDNYIGGQPSVAPRIVPAATQQENQAPLQPKIVADNVPNAMFDGDVFENPFAPPSTSAAKSSFSQYVDPSNMHTTMKLKNVKEAMTDPVWIDLMQEELLQFKTLDNHFFKGTIDPMLFIRRFDDDILLAKPTEKHLKEVKRIFHYLRGTVNMGLWYTKDSGFELTGFSNVDYAGCKDTFKILLVELNS